MHFLHKDLKGINLLLTRDSHQLKAFTPERPQNAPNASTATNHSPENQGNSQRPPYPFKIALFAHKIPL
jgi:hypothetical protein